MGGFWRTETDATTTDGAARLPAVDFAKGVLLLLALAPMAGLAPAMAHVQIAKILGELLIGPGFLFLAGFLAARAPRPQRLALRGLIPLLLLCALLGVIALAFRQAPLALIQEAAPALRLLALPVLYTLAFMGLRRFGWRTLIAIALVAHIYGVMGGATFRFFLPLFVFFVAGAFFARRWNSFRAAVARHPAAAGLAGPIVLAFALLLAAHIPPGAFSVARFGPAALGVGVGAGLTLLAMGEAFASDAPMMTALGRKLRLLSALWPATFFLLAQFAARADEQRPLGYMLLSFCALASLSAALDAAGALRRAKKPAMDRAQA
jgi:hypothetical protein